MVHLDTRFLRINVDNAPFLVTKLKVQVLPCVLAFVDGVACDRIVGFEGLGSGGDAFSTTDLETRLLHAEVLRRAVATTNLHATNSARGRETKNAEEEDEDEDDDWD